MLTLLDPNYRPPSGYGVLQEQGYPDSIAASRVYEMVEYLKGTAWWPVEYGCDPDQFFWRGTMSGLIWGGHVPDTIWFLLPADVNGSSGFGADWMAFHSSAGAVNYSVNPWLASMADWEGGVSHELFEALTDSPPGTGWVHEDPYAEGADLCGMGPWLSIGGYSISSYFSNQLGRCLAQSDV